MNRTTPPATPALKELSPRRLPATGARSDFAMSLGIVTPILGGGYRTRAQDDVDLIRVPTVRGHLRFWWRSLFAGRFERSASLCLGSSTVRGHARPRAGSRGSGADLPPVSWAVRGPAADGGRALLVVGLDFQDWNFSARGIQASDARWTARPAGNRTTWHSRSQATASTEGRDGSATCVNDPGDLLPRSNDGTGVLEGSGTVMRARLICVHHPMRDWKWS